MNVASMRMLRKHPSSSDPLLSAAVSFNIIFTEASRSSSKHLWILSAAAASTGWRNVDSWAANAGNGRLGQMQEVFDVHVNVTTSCHAADPHRSTCPSQISLGGNAFPGLRGVTTATVRGFCGVEVLRLRQLDSQLG